MAARASGSVISFLDVVSSIYYPFFVSLPLSSIPQTLII
ncbi:hypothetical protein SLEP1_g58775 [Rubroshorea leprosula]|uniref:Uncharacterized protein n=1 Tax=Rubroshorea leprosula TaxID=152421 RepID=A0AAV5MSW5_9ROSI|nr:hypothetical protein SLEP1_g58775 [Rubroshorea leprosula]